MVKCGRCGVNVDDSFDICPNCGNALVKEEIKEKPNSTSDNPAVCSNCGATLKANDAFCSSCGSKVEAESQVNRCETCGGEIPDGVLFCPTCGTKVTQKIPQVKRCDNCGSVIEDGTTFCPECGTNIFTGEAVAAPQTDSNQSFTDKINISSMLVPTILSLIVSVILSMILFWIGFSWISFIIAIVLSVGFFAGIIDNEANAMVSGFFVGLILGILENPIVEFVFGRLAARLYDWIFGGQLIFLVILGIVIAYISNKYFKENIQGIVDKFLSWI